MHVSHLLLLSILECKKLMVLLLNVFFKQEGHVQNMAMSFFLSLCAEGKGLNGNAIDVI
jgi:hypothetical protein